MFLNCFAIPEFVLETPLLRWLAMKEEITAIVINEKYSFVTTKAAMPSLSVAVFQKDGEARRIAVAQEISK